MIAQLMLSALLGGILLYAWTEYKRTPLIGMMSMVAALTGLYFVWMPEHATRLAALVGIGRGVDLNRRNGGIHWLSYLSLFPRVDRVIAIRRSFFAALTMQAIKRLKSNATRG